jgi:hypothetical protein
MTLIEALKRVAAAAEDHPPLREAIVALVDTAAERVMAEVKDESPPEGFDEGVMTLAAAVAAAAWEAFSQSAEWVCRTSPFRQWGWSDMERRWIIEPRHISA